MRPWCVVLLVGAWTLTSAVADPGGVDAPDEGAAALLLSAGTHSGDLPPGDVDWYRIAHPPEDGVLVTLAADIGPHEYIFAMMYDAAGRDLDALYVTGVSGAGRVLVTSPGEVRLELYGVSRDGSPLPATRAYELTLAVVGLPDVAVEDVVVTKTVRGIAPGPGPDRKIDVTIANRGLTATEGEFVIDATTTGDGESHFVCVRGFALEGGRSTTLTCSWNSSRTVGDSNIRVRAWAYDPEVTDANNRGTATTFAWVEGVPGESF